MWTIQTAAIAALASALIAIIACVLCVRCLSRASNWETRLRSTASLHGELVEIRDYMSKVDAWLKRINTREVMNERRKDAGGRTLPRGFGDSPGPANESRKDALRRRAGLTAGRAPLHRDDGEVDQ